MAIRQEWVLGRHQTHFEEPHLLLVKMGDINRLRAKQVAPAS